MTTVSVTDLTNAKTDVDHIAAIATSTALTATDRLGTTKKTLQGAINSISAITDRGAWVTATAYAVKDVVLDTGVYYICITAHTSGGTFSGDAAKWRVYQGDLGAYHSVDVVNDIRSNDFSSRKMIRIATERGNPIYYLDSSDTVSADDDFLVIVDAGLNRWKLVKSSLKPEANSAVGNGVTEDTTAVLGFLNNTRVWTSDQTGKYAVAPISIADDKVLNAVSITGVSGSAEILRTSGAVDKIKIIGADIDCPTGIALHNNSANCKNISLIGSDVRSDTSYGVLSNNASSGTDGFVVLGSHIKARADAIEWNHPNADSYNFGAVGNVLSGGEGGSGAAGFAVGIAGTQGHVTVANNIAYSRLEAIHVEDNQECGVIGHNAIRQANTEAFRITESPEAAANPVVYNGNWANHAGVKTGIVGLRLVNDGNGHVKQNILTSNVLKGFGTAISQEGAGIQITDNNLGIDCDLLVNMTDKGAFFGTSYAKNCTKLADASARSIVGKLVSDTNILVPMTKRGTNAGGPVAKGLYMPFSMVTTGGITENFDMVTLPSRMFGRIIIQASSGANAAFYSATIHWDGTTLLLTDVISQHAGATSSSTLANNGGNLAFRMFAASAITFNAHFDFDGVFYVHS